jgi:putative FmdB family regulatory protein
MPLYGFQCAKCDHSFSDVLKVDDRNKPLDEPCPNCKESGGVTKTIGAPLIVSGVGDFRKNVPDVFKDRLREIKKTSGRGCTIDV